MLIVNIKGSKEIEKGDKVRLIGNQGNLKISVSSFGGCSKPINYEFLSRLP